MKKIALPIVIMFFLVFLPAKTFGSANNTPVANFKNTSSNLHQRAESPSNLIGYEISPTELMFFPFEIFEAVDCDMNESMALIELIKAAETEKQLQVEREAAAAKLLLVPKQEVIEVARPIQKMGIAEIMFIIEEVGRGAMY